LSKSAARALTVAPFALLLAVVPAQAQREDQGLQLGCANDYFRLCAGVDPNSSDAERCMERNRKRLSPDCRAAIGDYDRRTGTRSMKGSGED
jgi:hypothetical protein